MPWTPGTLVTTPAVDAVLVDTGALPAGGYDIEMLIAHNIGANLELYLQHRNAANSATLRSQLVVVSGSELWLKLGVPIVLGTDERVRLLNRNDLTATPGDVQASFLYRRTRERTRTFQYDTVDI